MPLTVTCPKCHNQLGVPDSAVGSQIRCGVCQTVIAIAAPAESAPDLLSSLPPAQSTPPQTAPKPPRPVAPQPLVRTGPPRQNTAPPDRQLVWALAGVFSMVIVGMLVAIAILLLHDREEVEPTVAGGRAGGGTSSTVESPDVPTKQIKIAEGLAFHLPEDFVPLDRSGSKDGDIIYTFFSESDRGANGELRISSDRNSTPDSPPPVVLAQPPENFQAPIVQLNGQYYFPKDRTELTSIGGMSAVVHRIDFAVELRGQKRSSEGWFVHAMDEGRVITLQLMTTGKMPMRAWHAAVTSLRKTPPPPPEQIPEPFQP